MRRQVALCSAGRVAEAIETTFRRQAAHLVEIVGIRTHARAGGVFADHRATATRARQTLIIVVAALADNQSRLTLEIVIASAVL